MEGDTLVYLLIAVVLLIVVVQIISVMPSKNERTLGKIRQRAIGDGLHVKCIWPEKLDWLKTLSLPGPLMEYRMSLENEGDSWRCVPNGLDSIHWHLEGEPSGLELKSILVLKEILGDDLVAIDREQLSLSVYWVESMEKYQAVKSYLVSEGS